MSNNLLPKPPKFSNWVLSWLLDDDWETPAGDFEEAFHRISASQGQKQARRWYRIQVLGLIPERVVEKTFWGIVMLGSNLKMAVRTLRKSPLYAAVNIGGLAIGMATFLLIALFIQNELAFDSMYSKADNVVRISEVQINGDGSERLEGFTRAAAGPAALNDIPEVETYIRMIGQNFFGRGTVTSSSYQFYEGDYYFTEPSFFQAFDLPFLSGDPATALAQPNSAVITESAAIKYFGTTDAIGEELVAERMGEFTITGVLKDLPDNTHLAFNLLYSLSTIAGDSDSQRQLSDWDNSGVLTYLLLQPGTSVPEVEAKVVDLFSRNLSADNTGIITPFLQSLTDIHFESASIQNEDNAHESSPDLVWIFGLVALLIIVIAVLNYTNMATAASMSRTKEVGLRKAIGAHRGQLVRQFFGESLVTVSLSIALAFFIAKAALPAFNGIVGKSLEISINAGWTFIGLTILTMLFIGMLSSVFPALLMSRTQPVVALKGGIETQKGTPRLRQVLVTVQFTLSIGLIISSLIVLDQLAFIQNRDLGFSKDQLLIVDINSGDVRAGYKTIVQEYERVAGVEGVSVSSRVPGDWKPIAEIDVRSAESGPESILGSFFLSIDEKFLSTYKMDLVEGRNLQPDSHADSLSVLINESAATALGVTLGDRLSIPGGRLRSRFAETTFEPTVVGIVKDFNFRSLHQPIRPMVLGAYPSPIQSIDYFTIKLASTPTLALMDELQAVGVKFDPDRPWEINFLDSRLQDFYAAEVRFKNVFGFATGLAIIIACLGLFGLTTFTVVRKTKEIGIRKVMGSSSSSIVGMLSKEIAMLVTLSFTIAAPVSWIIMQSWLSNFAYHTTVNPLTLIFAALITFICALGSVSYQSIRASRLNPVECLRCE